MAVTWRGLALDMDFAAHSLKNRNVFSFPVPLLYEVLDKPSHYEKSFLSTQRGYRGVLAGVSSERKGGVAVFLFLST